MPESKYYVKFRRQDGEIDKKYVMARNCSDAVEKVKEKYNYKSIIKTGKSINERSVYDSLF